MSILTNLKAYYIDEGSLQMFLAHKGFHVVMGALAGLVAVKLTGLVLVGILAAFLIGVGKEVVDQIKTAGQYHETYVSSVLDVIITTSGSLLQLPFYSGDVSKFLIDVSVCCGIMFICLLVADNGGVA